MIVGNGLIATNFENFDRDDVVFYASGVSNSLETDPAKFQREQNLIRKTLTENSDKIFVYFSTCSIYDSSKNDSFYVNHKLHMEHIIAENAKKYLIARVSNAVGKGGNQQTLINFLTSSIQENKQINVHIDATRNLIDVEDVANGLNQIIEKGTLNRIVNVAYPFNYTILEVIKTIEDFLGKNANLDLKKEGQNYTIDISDFENYFRDNLLMDRNRYLKNMLEKYYQNFLS